MKTIVYCFEETKWLDKLFKNSHKLWYQPLPNSSKRQYTKVKWFM